MSKRYLIVFTGIDGSGKTTQAELLAKNLRQDGLHVSYVWSRWEPFFLKPLLKRWRSGAAKDTAVSGSDFNKIKAKKQRLLNNPVFRWLWLTAFFIDYGLQIFVKIRIRLIKRQLIISDRIFYDSVIDQAVNLGKRKDWLMDNLSSFWIKIFFPQPDIVMYIDCPEDIAFSRKDDINTPNVEYLRERRELYLKLADKYGWIKIEGTLPVDKIAVQVKEKVYERMSR